MFFLLDAFPGRISTLYRPAFILVSHHLCC